jgi:predicted PurR-regulated permease PerM
VAYAGRVNDGIRRAGQVAWAVLGMAALLLLLGVLAWSLRVIWGPLIFGGAIVFLLNPIVRMLSERGIPRVFGALLTYLGFVGLATIAVLAVVPIVVDQADELTDEWPSIQANMQQWVNDRAADTETWFISLPSFDEVESEVRSENDRSLGERLDQARGIGSRLLNIGLILLLGPVLAFYLLIDLPRLKEVVEGLVPAAAQDDVALIGNRLNRAIGGFFRGQLMVALIVGMLVSTGLAVIDLPFWLLVGMIAGLSNIVPLIGPWVGAVPAIVIALTTRDLTTAAWAVAIMAGVQQLESQIISPLVMNRAVKVHPAAVLLALVAGGSLFGLPGLLLAVPAVAILKIIAGHLWRRFVLGQSLDELIDHSIDAVEAPGGPLRDVAKEEMETGSESGPDPDPDAAVERSEDDQGSRSERPSVEAVDGEAAGGRRPKGTPP